MSKSEPNREYLKKGQAIAIIFGGVGIPVWLALVLIVKLSDVPAKIDSMEQWQHREDMWRARVSERLGIAQDSARRDAPANPNRPTGALADFTDPESRLSSEPKPVN